MKKTGIVALAAAGALWAGANFVPGFWSFVPAGVVAAIPGAVVPVLQSYFKFPAPTAGAPQQAKAGGGGGGQGGRPTPVMMGNAERRTVPVMVETIGTVQAISTVTVRSRVDSQIDEVLFADGANVKQGDILARLDSRAIRAQIAQAEATLARDTATLELARSTLKRGEELADKSFATKQRLDENRANVAAQEAQVKAGQAQVELLKTQLTYYTIKAPISGRAGLANIKPGNMARSSDGATPLTTINQIAPIYISFSLPQRYFQELREALASGTGKVEAQAQGGGPAVAGKLALLENTMDNTTGTIGVRATFDNANEALWPGVIADLRITLRDEPDVVTVPREAVQMSQRGTYVFVVEDGTARMQPVTMSRSVGKQAVIASGLKGGEKVITDGQLLVVNGARVQPRQPAAAATLPAGGKSL